MFKQTVLFGLVIGCMVTFNALSSEKMKTVPASLEEATTFEEIQAFVEQAFAKVRENLKTLEDQERFFETYPPIGIEGGRKIIALGGDEESLEYGYGILLAALHWSLRKHPENAKEIEKLGEELNKIGKFPDMVENTKFYLFYHRCRLLSDAVSQDEFDAIKKEAKYLATLTQSQFSTSGPMEKVLDLAQKISIADENPRFLDDVLEELIRFRIETADTPEKKEAREVHLRGYFRRMVGSPFELWGKTVDGNDFNWDDYKDKVVLIEFTASWCGPCRGEMPNIVEVYNQYHGKGLEVVSIGYEDTTDNLKKMIEEDKVPFTMVSEELSKDDPRGLPSGYYGVDGIPEIFLIGKDGRIIATGLRGATLRDAVEKQFIDP